MTIVKSPPGSPLALGPARLAGSGWGLPQLLSDGASAATSNRPATTITASATPHSVGAWQQVVAALSADVGFVRLTPTATIAASTTNTSVLVNLGVGGAGSEVTVLPSLNLGYWSSTTDGQHPGWTFPLFIAAGSRVALQAQAAVISQSVGVRVEFFSPLPGLEPSTKVVALGAVTASSRGTALATPAANNTEGAWTQIHASTPEPFRALGVAFAGGSDTTLNTGEGLVDIAVGASGAEVPIIRDLMITTSLSEIVRSVSPLVHPCSIPMGSRLAARWQHVSASGNSLDVVLYGVR